jgi:hypothetical protein
VRFTHHHLLGPPVLGDEDDEVPDEVQQVAAVEQAVQGSINFW